MRASWARDVSYGFSARIIKAGTDMGTRQRAGQRFAVWMNSTRVSHGDVKAATNQMALCSQVSRLILFSSISRQRPPFDSEVWELYRAELHLFVSSLQSRTCVSTCSNSFDEKVPNSQAIVQHSLAAILCLVWSPPVRSTITRECWHSHIIPVWTYSECPIPAHASTEMKLQRMVGVQSNSGYGCATCDPSKAVYRLWAVWAPDYTSCGMIPRTSTGSSDPFCCHSCATAKNHRNRVAQFQ